MRFKIISIRFALKDLWTTLTKNSRRILPAIPTISSRKRAPLDMRGFLRQGPRGGSVQCLNNSDLWPHLTVSSACLGGGSSRLTDFPQPPSDISGLSLGRAALEKTLHDSLMGTGRIFDFFQVFQIWFKTVEKKNFDWYVFVNFFLLCRSSDQSSRPAHFKTNCLRHNRGRLRFGSIDRNFAYTRW